MFARLETSFESEKQFTSDASHELRTPVAVILAQCEDARRHAQDPAQYTEAIDVIERQAGRMRDLIAQLLQMTRLEQGAQRANFEQADLSGLVEVLCEEQPALPHGVTIRADVQPGVEAWLDVTLISRLLQNLIDKRRALWAGKTAISGSRCAAWRGRCCSPCGTTARHPRRPAGAHLACGSIRWRRRAAQAAARGSA